ncbi:NADPH-dependent FMN reductase [Phytoactinopolyspora mesophila]|uniref:NADPH-dependent oxidoreductase n=1 Tax=Phytoactinopolyspora mesophila TaxID=2650750 RepID=A0A7K3LZP0_9ACTN|nr:NAD(P)H-dependent oxidoreductase [Phytoactinopolyspora mesophila]NDL56496.1 NADPH-dependent oxidoreductase [Phytoactinopolyspora mesophila]
MTVGVTVVVGNPKPMSRTREIAERVVDKVLQPGTYTCTVIDLADYADEIFRWPSQRLDALNNAVADSDLVVVASPTYKAAYTGLLKAFLDRYSSNALAGVVVIPVHTGADLSHSMAPTVTLAPLLMELGAVVPGRGLYIPISEWARGGQVLDEMVAECIDSITRLARLSPACRLAAESPDEVVEA